jgi:periplasmic copper chaperone A
MTRPLVPTFAAIIMLVLSGGACAGVSVSNPWVRGVVAGQTVTGAFMTLKSSEDVRLVEAASPVAGKVEIHKMAMENDLMTMRPISALEVPANTVVELRPGGYHVMLIDLKKPLVTGERIPLKLTFEGKNGARNTVDIRAEVHKLTAQ